MVWEDNGYSNYRNNIFIGNDRYNSENNGNNNVATKCDIHNFWVYCPIELKFGEKVEIIVN